MFLKLHEALLFRMLLLSLLFSSYPIISPKVLISSQLEWLKTSSLLDKNPLLLAPKLFFPYSSIELGKSGAKWFDVVLSQINVVNEWCGCQKLLKAATTIKDIKIKKMKQKLERVCFAGLRRLH